MKPKAHRPIALGFGLCAAAAAMLAFAPVAEAQFFWSPFFQEQQPKKPKPRRTAPKPPSDDLPPIVPKESSAPPPPDDRPYDPKLLRLAEILGAVHYLRELCGADEGQLWREQMTNILKYEGSTAVRRAKLVNSFNDGYRGYRRTYRSCTSSATLAISRFSIEGAQIAAALAKPSGYASKGPVGETAATEGATATDAGGDGTAKKEEDNANKPAEPSANAAEPEAPKGKKSRRSKQAAKQRAGSQAPEPPD
jgi:uncharacterized protein (TIGR02301 family)